jgi:hypothetical protein
VQAKRSGPAQAFGRGGLADIREKTIPSRARPARLGESRRRRGALVGGSGNTFSPQPLTIEGGAGLGFTAGVESLLAPLDRTT